MTIAGASVQGGRKAATARLRSVDLTGPAGRLEAVVNEGSPDAPFAALMCHPHPAGGGTMHNKVVYHAMKAMNAPEWGLGWPVLRFNFRGTGRSEGAHHGKEEWQDVLAALDWLEDAYGLPIVVGGFSFGAAMALKACMEAGTRVHAVAALGLPAHAEGRTYRYSFLRDLHLPKLFLSGDQDRYATSAELESIVAAAAEPRKLVLIPGADHFFTGQLPPLQTALASWLKEQAP